MKKKRRRLNKRGKRTLAGLVIIVFILTLAIITNPKDEEKMSKNEKREPDKVEPTPEVKKEVQIIDLNSNSRNIAVMINNIKNVWGYQSGLQDAYLVYEMIVEGGYTRLMAIFKDKMPERIGSIRSARPYYLDYALENDAIYVHFGGSDQALAEIPTLQIPNINFMNDSGYWRDTSLGLATEHTAFTSMQNIKNQIDKKKYRSTTESKPLLNYEAEEISFGENAKPANKIFIEYSGIRNTSFEYDSTAKVYKRYQNGVAHTDYVTKTQYTAKNIIVYQVENHSLDDYGRQGLSNIGSGTGYYISNGLAVEITWEKNSRGGKTVYKLLDGTPLSVNDGNTYIEIQPKNRTLTIE